MAGALVAISALPASTTILSTDILPFVKSGTTDKITAGNLRTQLFAFAASDPLNCGVLTVVGNSTVTGTLTGMTDLTSAIYRTGTAVGKFVPGATSFSFRNNADSADNLLITDAGVATVRSNLAVTGGTLTLSAAVSKIVPGATSLSLRNTADTANNLILTDAGAATFRSSVTGITTLNTSGLITTTGGINITGGSFAAGSIYQAAGTGLTMGMLSGSGFDFQLTNPAGSVGVIRVPTGTSTVQIAGSLQFAATNSKILPGATNLSFRNNADGADNVVITDAGNTTVSRGTFNVTTGLSTIQALSATTGTFSSTVSLTTAASKIVPGSSSLTLRNNADNADNLVIVDAGNVTVSRGNLIVTAGSLQFSTAAGKVIPGATSLTFRDNADANDNFVIANNGATSVRGSLSLASTLNFTSAACKIIPGATSFSVRDNADSVDRLLLNASGFTVLNTLITTASATGAVGFRLPHGTAPTSPTDGDMWSTTTTLNFRLNGVTKSVNLT